MNVSMIKQLKDFKRIQDTPLTQDSFDEIQCFPECGGIGIFIGTVRNHHEGKAVKALKYTSYAPVSEKMIRHIEQEIQEKFAVSYVRVIHRVGALDIGEKAIIAIAYAPHRREAFEACEEAVERVKHEVPVWKEEFYVNGTSQYVAGCCIRKDYVQTNDQPLEQYLQKEHVQNHSNYLHDCERAHEHKQNFDQSNCHHSHHHLEHSQDIDSEQQALLMKPNEQTIYQWHL